jgi:hypothetical protein
MLCFVRKNQRQEGKNTALVLGPPRIATPRYLIIDTPPKSVNSSENHNVTISKTRQILRIKPNVLNYPKSNLIIFTICIC